MIKIVLTHVFGGEFSKQNKGVKHLGTAAPVSGDCRPCGSRASPAPGSRPARSRARPARRAGALGWLISATRAHRLLEGHQQRRRAEHRLVQRNNERAPTSRASRAARSGRRHRRCCSPRRHREAPLVAGAPTTKFRFLRISFSPALLPALFFAHSSNHFVALYLERFFFRLSIQ